MGGILIDANQRKPVNISAEQLIDITSGIIEGLRAKGIEKGFVQAMEQHLEDLIAKHKQGKLQPLHNKEFLQAAS